MLTFWKLGTLSHSFHTLTFDKSVLQIEYINSLFTYFSVRTQNIERFVQKHAIWSTLYDESVTSICWRLNIQLPAFSLLPFLACRRSYWLRTSETGREGVGHRSVWWKEEMRNPPQSWWKPWRLCSAREVGIWRGPHLMTKSSKCRAPTSGSISKNFLPQYDIITLLAIRWICTLFYFSVFETDGNLVVHEVATQPLTQDMLRSNVSVTILCAP